jgi:hypothetical protein
MALWTRTEDSAAAAASAEAEALFFDKFNLSRGGGGVEDSEPLRGGGSRHALAFDFREMFYCPISMQVMLDPVQTVDGFTYERQLIEEWLGQHDSSPSSGAPLTCKTLTPNIALKAAIQEWEDITQVCIKTLVNELGPCIGLVIFECNIPALFVTLDRTSGESGNRRHEAASPRAPAPRFPPRAHAAQRHARTAHTANCASTPRSTEVRQ